jgi:CheY-like chemotaxis protein
MGPPRRGVSESGAAREQRVAERDQEIDREHDRPEHGDVHQRPCAFEIANDEQAEPEKRGARGPGEQMAKPLAPLAGRVLRAGPRRSLGHRTPGEAVREARIRPVDDPMSPGDRDADVNGGEGVRQGGLAPAAQIDRRNGEQEQVDERCRYQQGEAHARPPEHVAGNEAGEEGRPESDLRSDDESDTHGGSNGELTGNFLGEPPLWREAAARIRVWTTAPQRGTGRATIPNVTTVLIVDDHPSFRGTARALLESEGFDVVGEAADGASAIEATKSLHPDVVLLDVYLPDIDGFEVAATLTRNGRTPAIVMTSSRDARDFGPLVEQSGARGFIAKAELSGATLSALLE